MALFTLYISPKFYGISIHNFLVHTDITNLTLCSLLQSLKLCFISYTFSSNIFNNSRNSFAKRTLFLILRLLTPFFLSKQKNAWHWIVKIVQLTKVNFTIQNNWWKKEGLKNLKRSICDLFVTPRWIHFFRYHLSIYIYLFNISIII